MKIAVLLSGGVDSSVSLRLLHEQGHQLEAFYLKIWLEDELAYLGQCPWEEDLAYAQAVCDQIGIKLHIVPLQKEYWEHVVSYTISEVRQGRTPSPDLLCNQRIKFGCFLEHIDDSYEKIATGHYARNEFIDGKWRLKKAVDPVKDQTYFLAYLSQEQLDRLVFPIGGFMKSQVRELAERYQLPNKARKDSQGICFLGKIKFSEFVRHHLGSNPGDLVEFETGRVLGRHDGFWYHTVGQRKGLGLSGGPWFVVKKDVAANIVYISRQYHDEHLARNKFDVESIHWINGTPQSTDKMQIKVRHGEHVYNAQVLLHDENKASVGIDGNDQGLAPGQFAVFYQDDICLGCAVISE